MLAVSLLTGQERAAVILRPIFGVLLVVNANPIGLADAQVRPALDQIGTRQQLLGTGVLALGGGLDDPVLPGSGRRSRRPADRGGFAFRGELGRALRDRPAASSVPRWKDGADRRQAGRIRADRG